LLSDPITIGSIFEILIIAIIRKDLKVKENLNKSPASDTCWITKKYESLNHLETT